MPYDIEFSDPYNLSWAISENGFEPVSEEKKNKLRPLYNKLGKLLDFPEESSDPVAEIEEVEFALQDAWGFPVTPHHHGYWYKIRGCTCPARDNRDSFGTGIRYINNNCKWHGQQVSE